MADKREHEQLQQAEIMYKAAYRQHVLTRIAVGHKLNDSEIPGLVPSTVLDINDDDEDEDDSYLVQYRQKRLKGYVGLYLSS